MGSGDILKGRNRRIRVASIFLAAGLGSGALLAACGSGQGNAAPSSTPSVPTFGSETPSTGPSSTDPQHPYLAISGRIVNTEGTDGRPNGTRVYSGPRNRPEDQVNVASVLSQNAPVQVLCRIAVGRTLNLDPQSSPEVINKLGHTRTDWDLVQGPLPGKIADPVVTAGAEGAGGWVPAGFVDVGMKIDEIPKCHGIPPS